MLFYFSRFVQQPGVKTHGDRLWPGTELRPNICGTPDRHCDFNAGFLGMNEILTRPCCADLSHSRNCIVEGHSCFNPERFSIVEDTKNVERRNHGAKPKRTSLN